ncbi:MAG: PKD domain-containing protein [Planctomycetes bacterium]|nr:PKD domain-containing protein [Planctomycetota bacterium]
MFNLRYGFWSLALLMVFTLTACGKGSLIEPTANTATTDGNSTENEGGTDTISGKVRLSGILFESKGGSLIAPLPSATLSLASDVTGNKTVLDSTDSLGWFDAELDATATATVIISADNFNDIVVSPDLTADKSLYVLLQQLDSKYYNISSTIPNSPALTKAQSKQMESSDKTNTLVLSDWDMEEDIKLWITPWNNPNSPPAVKSETKGITGKAIAGANVQIKKTSDANSSSDISDAEFTGKIYPYSFKIIGDLSAYDINSLVSAKTTKLSLWFYADDPEKPGKDYTWQKAGGAEISYVPATDSVTLSPADGVFLTDFQPYVFVIDDASLPKITVTGKVTDGSTSEPVSGAMLLCNDQINVSNEAGEYSMTISFPEYTQQVSLTVTANGYISKTAYISITGANSSVTKDFSLTPTDALETSEIEGSVTDLITGLPIANADVTLRTQSVLSELTTAQFGSSEGVIAGLNSEAEYKWEIQAQKESGWMLVKKGAGANILYPDDLTSKFTTLGMYDDSLFTFKLTVTFASSFIETISGELSVEVSMGGGSNGNVGATVISYKYAFLLPPPQAFSELTIKSQSDGSYFFKDISADLYEFLEIQAGKTGYITSTFQQLPELTAGGVIIKNISLQPAESQNKPPSVTALVDKTTGPSPLTVNFSCEAIDSDGTIVAYNWAFGDGGVSTLTSPSHTYNSAGNYTATVTVMDNKNAKAISLLTISVTDAVKSAPIINVNADSYNGKAPMTVTFTANAFDSDGTIESYYWDFGNGDTSFEQNPVQTFENKGAYIVTATVTDNDGLTANALVEIYVSNPENTPPTAGIAASPIEGVKGLSVQFNAKAEDADGYITDYQWDFGDGTINNMQDTSYIYIFSGTYTVTLTVTDNSGATAAAQITITVKDPEIAENTTAIAEKVFVSNGYAYVACGNAGLKVIDVSNPENPIETAVYNTPGYAYGIFVSGNYAYVADGSTGLLVIDIANQSAPSLAGSYKTLTSARNVFIAGNYAYVPDMSALQIIDVSNPAEPASKSVYYITDGTAAMGGICVAGNYAYFTCIATGFFGWGLPNGGYKILDVVDPANPLLIADNTNYCIAAQAIYSDKYSTFVCGLTMNFSYLAGSEMTGTVSSGSYREEKYMSIFYPDGNYPTDVPPPLINDIKVVGNDVYMAYGGLGLYIIDTTSYTSGVKKASYDTPGTARGLDISGNYAYVADGYQGLQIINISQPLLGK